MKKINLLLLTDSYKLTHWKQYPPKTQKVYSYFESRGGKFEKTLFFGLQYFLKKYLVGEVFNVTDIVEAKLFTGQHVGSKDLFNYDGWLKLFRKHKGKLPISIKAVPEGTLVENSNVLMTIENTDPEFHWLTNYLETLLVQVWYPCTVATQSYYMKQNFLKYLEETGDTSLIPYKLHDFGFRGVSSVETAGIGGAAHLVNFQGTDNIAGITMIKEYYGEPMAGFSIPASEHSTMTAWGKDNEVKAFENMLDQFPKGLMACVSDSFDIYKACEDLWGSKLRDKVVNREGTLVVRPDSGDAVEVTLKVLDILALKFGFTTNDKGYKVLNPKVRVIQGDGIDYSTMNMVLMQMKEHGWSVDNIAFGSGGGLLQKLNRDTLKFAFKCSNVTIDGKDIEVFKEPITSGIKKSKAGRLKLYADVDGYKTMSLSEEAKRAEHGGVRDELVEVFRDGELLVDWNFSEIRERAK